MGVIEAEFIQRFSTIKVDQRRGKPRWSLHRQAPSSTFPRIKDLESTKKNVSLSGHEWSSRSAFLENRTSLACPRTSTEDRLGRRYFFSFFFFFLFVCIRVVSSAFWFDPKERMASSGIPNSGGMRVPERVKNNQQDEECHESELQLH